MVVGVPPPPTAIPKSFHPVPSIYRAILVNIPSLKKKAESREKKKKNTQLQPCAARTHDVDDAREEDAEVTVSTSQVIAILSGAASPTPLRATTPLVGSSLGRLGRGLRRGREPG